MKADIAFLLQNAKKEKRICEDLLFYYKSMVVKYTEQINSINENMNNWQKVLSQLEK